MGVLWGVELLRPRRRWRCVRVVWRSVRQRAAAPTPRHACAPARTPPQVPPRQVAAMLAGKLLLHPAVGLACCAAASHSGLLPRGTDPLMLLVLLLAWASPTAVLVHSLATVLQVRSFVGPRGSGGAGAGGGGGCLRGACGLRCGRSRGRCTAAGCWPADTCARTLITHARPCLCPHNTPTLNTHTQNGEDEVSSLLFWQYLASLVTLPAWLAAYLQLLQAGWLAAGPPAAP
jgi:hypothetical protein